MSNRPLRPRTRAPAEAGMVGSANTSSGNSPALTSLMEIMLDLARPIGHPPGLSIVPRDCPATVAYSVFPAHHGRGIAPWAVLLVADWALRDLGVAQLILEADEANAASIRGRREVWIPCDSHQA
ncbi:GNAT family N-acetyltransferase [Actinoplanes sp. NPDC026623]|uniref:GNAT family N-acetyltransferase n=1 Tax=Actinoplanes sp. NPDC026623 TaxID=3155610 RepID=UPI0033C2A104